MDAEKLVDIGEIAKRTGLPVSWIYVNAAKSKMPCYRIGKYVRFRLSEVEAWLQAQRQGPVER